MIQAKLMPVFDRGFDVFFHRETPHFASKLSCRSSMLAKTLRIGCQWTDHLIRETMPWKPGGEGFAHRRNLVLGQEMPPIAILIVRDMAGLETCREVDARMLTIRTREHDFTGWQMTLAKGVPTPLVLILNLCLESLASSSRSAKCLIRVIGSFLISS